MMVRSLDMDHLHAAVLRAVACCSSRARETRRSCRGAFLKGVYRECADLYIRKRKENSKSFYGGRGAATFNFEND